jgi:spore maturation protein B
MSAYIVPALFILLLTVAAIKKKNPYNAMLFGAKEGAASVIRIFPYIMVIMLALKLMQASGFDALITKALSPLLTWTGIPSELTYLVILRPVSGSGSLAMLAEIYAKYGPDSYISRCASLIVDGSDTIFYMAGVYFAETKVKNIGLVILLALLVSIIGAIVGCWLCRFM